jgi:hypothetical protein
VTKETGSLLHGRGNAPLTEEQQEKISAAFYFFDRTANVRFDPGRTRFRPINGNADLNHEILFGPDILPGPNIADPNACLSMRGAVVHELAHKTRHDDATEINDPTLEHIDEALTSLSAILKFQRKLEDFEILGLVSDAVQRLQLHVAQLQQGENAAAEAPEQDQE